MTIVELKEAILNNTLSDKLLILVCPENTFLADQYVDAICKAHELDRVAIDSIFDSQQATVTLFEHPQLFVLHTDTFKEAANNYDVFTNTVVICTDVDKKVEGDLIDYMVTMPKLQEWQVVSYIQTHCPELSEADAAWMYKAAGGNIYKLNLELEKLELFSGDQLMELVQNMKYAHDTNLYTIEPFDLANAIGKNDRLAVYSFLQHAKYCEMEPILLVNLLLSSMKKVAIVTASSNNNFESAGISSKQAYAIRAIYNNRTCPLPRLRKILHFLTNIDFKLKSGLLDMSKSEFIDYLICNLMSCAPDEPIRELYRGF